MKGEILLFLSDQQKIGPGQKSIWLEGGFHHLIQQFQRVSIIQAFFGSFEKIRILLHTIVEDIYEAD